ncbi:hypothetical protein B7Y94_01990 [Candidatus Saccharibacteria bacterium 32-49-12]|nr:MAG: hypothetical protein B7Y94_01990 [Candidatus Saccharibacteria bacterium 32-49-12]
MNLSPTKRPISSKFIGKVLIGSLAAATVFTVAYATFTGYRSLEAESGLIYGEASSINDQSASSNSLLKFGYGSGSECTPSSVGAGGYPLPNLAGRASDCNTGPRYPCTSTFVGNFATSSDGQVIEGLCVNGELRVNHDNVTIRDSKILSGGLYGLDIGRDSPTCPTNTLIEYVEIDKSPAADSIPWGSYQRCPGGQVYDHVKIHNVGRGMMIYGNVTVKNSYIYSHLTAEGAHRSGISTHGGDNFNITNNTIICVNTGCSSAVNMYSDYAPVTDYLLQGNLVAGGSICVRGGQTHTYPNDTHDIRILNNRFSTLYAPECGTLQALAQFDSTAPGNIRSGNVWHESSLPITGE